MPSRSHSSWLVGTSRHWEYHLSRSSVDSHAFLANHLVIARRQTCLCIEEISVQHGLEASAQGTVPGRGRLAGRRILVVGGGQLTFGMEGAPMGNGRTISLLCGREGASVAVADVNGDAAAETAGLVASEGGTAFPLTADATDETSVQQMIETAVKQLGGLDGLVVNVGMGRGQGLEQTSVTEWDWVFALNVRAHFLSCKYALPVLELGSAITLTSSTAAVLPSTTEIPAYAASKAALWGDRKS